MPHLIRISLKQRPTEAAPYPFSVPQIRTLPGLDVKVGVTFFVGENGSGKSTLLEGIAAAAELTALGSGRRRRLGEGDAGRAAHHGVEADGEFATRMTSS